MSLDTISTSKVMIQNHTEYLPVLHGVDQISAAEEEVVMLAKEVALNPLEDY